MFKKYVPLVVVVLLLSACKTTVKGIVQKPMQLSSNNLKVVHQDTSKKLANKPKPYKEIITDKVITSKGLFTVHKVDDRYYFEVADSLLDNDILIVSRISKAGTRYRPLNGTLGYGGDEIGERIVRFSKGPNNKIFIKLMNFMNRTSDTSGNGMNKAVENSNLMPIVTSFDIKTFTPDSMASVIDLTDFINGDNDILFFRSKMKTIFKLASFLVDKSYLVGVKSFPINVEIKTVKTYMGAENEPITYELNSSLVLLPKIPMAPRNYDRRVGYFGVGYYDYDSPKGAEGIGLITRWRLEPKLEDIEKYKKGLLVEPQKPIVYYIDPATPKKWIPYLIAGVNDWQKAFEKAGFKNAIYAREAPVGDSTWSLEDARHNVIVYKAAQIPNASGPHVHDPRTGEILETHINWYHYVMVLLQDWYMVQAGPSDPEARSVLFKDKLMGQLIRFVASHEVGHTLGLMHNFGSSSTVSVERLRDKKWVEANGFCPSIMDYARFNYVAQPEDNISQKGLMPRIGVYDEWAIEWGYRWFPPFANRKSEKAYMNQWIVSKTNKDKRLWFGNEAAAYDPRRQSEDLGDDAIKAGYYGIKNLKLVLDKLPDWTHEPNEDFTTLKKMHGQVISQFQRYILHVTEHVGGIMENQIVQGDANLAQEFVPKEKQKAAIHFLHEELFDNPTWLKNERVLKLTGRTFLFDPMSIQRQVLTSITSHAIIINLLRFETNDPINSYTFRELLEDIEKGIWKELQTKAPIDFYRRNLQKVYVERLTQLLGGKIGSFEDNAIIAGPNKYTDTYSVIKNDVEKLIARISAALPGYKNEMSKIHLVDVRNRLKKALDNDKVEKESVEGNEEKKTFNNYMTDEQIQEDFPFFPNRSMSCWQNH